MPTWCHMFNSTLIGNARVWFNKLPRDSIDSYEDLRTTFRENYLQQTKHIKDPVEIHHIKQRDGESTEDFMERYKAEILDVEGAPECMKISGFMYGITHPELIKRLYEKIPRSMDEMYWVTTSFLQGEVAAFSYSRKKAPAPWKQPEGGNKPNFKKAEEADRRDDQVRQIVVIHQRIKAERQAKGTKEGGNGRKRQAPSHLDDSTMGEGEEDGTEGPMIIEAEIGGHFAPARNKKPDDPSYHITHRIQWRNHLADRPDIIGGEEHSTSAWINFMVIRSPSQHNGIIGRTGIRKIRAVPSTTHGMLKFSVKGGTVTIQSSRVIPMECAMISGPSTQHPVTSQIKPGCFCLEASRYDRRPVAHGRAPPKCPRGMPTCQTKKRGQAPERNKAIQEEVEKLVDVEIMKEVHYHSWLSNPDGYPLSEIDWKVESLCGYPFKCFLYAYKGYHQIKMAEEDEEKIAFIMSQGIFCYTKMPFGLKNAGATYQRLVDRAFQKQIGHKADAVLSLPSLGCLKDVQKLNGKLASLNRFLSKSAKKSLPFFKTLKKCIKKRNFQWTQEAEVSFKQMKKLIAELPMLTAPKENKELIIYLAAAKEAISAVLMTEKGGKQLPVLAQRKQTAEKTLPGTYNCCNYGSADKAIIAKDIDQRTNIDRFYHGSSCIDGSRAGLILTNSEGVEFTYAMRFRFEATNNEAEYEALIAGLWIAEQMGIKNLQANVDSRLVANQVNGSYVVKESGMVQYMEKVKTLASNFKEFSIKQVPQSENKKADALSKIASTSFAHLSKQVLVEELKEKSIHEKEILAVVEEEGQT
ncbi:reverse transcriptase domain-containing protein [Tanacetum coccineum]